MDNTPTNSAPTNSAQHDQFLRLFSHHSRQIFAFILSLVMRHSDADEVFQETSLVLWKKFAAYNPEQSFFAWACRIAELSILEQRRKNQKYLTISEEAFQLLADRMCHQPNNLDSRRKALEICLDKLPDSERQLIEQRYKLQLSPKEMADRSARSVYSIYRALTRVHTALLDCVQKSLAREAVR